MFDDGRMRRVVKWELESAEGWDTRFPLLLAGGAPSQYDRSTGATSMIEGRSFPGSQDLSGSLQGRARRQEGATEAEALSISYHVPNPGASPQPGPGRA